MMAILLLLAKSIKLYFLSTFFDLFAALLIFLFGSKVPVLSENALGDWSSEPLNAVFAEHLMLKLRIPNFFVDSYDKL